MKWLIWGPAIALVLSAFAVPDGIALFALPGLALGYLVFALIAPGGSEEHYTATRAENRARGARPSLTRNPGNEFR